ncbi:hypothetical protein A8924_3807 [Saccharopolyspora erythraea NRRL 2338]|uniref:Uncharacterized protein n=2 Tax=Saccharopolyspora erythraea TaxID=1836 RepID=A4FF65_SACEN|nr:DUF5313 family protein [Saccharopolyspora erythraea]EQD86036.1 hypothetical protein N599_11765 [Saccharopolyspora erythraea D]PFG96414.1 hypothetical protein A8924_3807 [Saccharopolyspora erythraea NRRL 2338]QRK92916.1 DUF5313 family protein [Saccharopolyspora erythraea]CAM02690.1 hypothetical protein SACE_3415 [Saccharopolyspora erythraea NRRL 2338]
MASRRPNPAQWVWYAFGGRLPDRYAEWVLHDVTCRTWLLRHVARALTQMLPFCALVLLLPGPLWIRLTSIALGLMVGLFYSLCFAVEMAEHRVIKHGYPPGIGRQTRTLNRDVRRAERHGVGYHPWWE